MTYRNTWPEKQEEISRFMKENPRAGTVSIEQIPHLEWCKEHLQSKYNEGPPIVIGESDPNFNHFRWEGFRSGWIDDVTFHGQVSVMSNVPYLIASLRRVKGLDHRDEFIILSAPLYYSSDLDSALEYLLKEF